MKFGVRSNFLSAHQGTEQETVGERWRKRKIGKRMLKQGVAVLLFVQKAIRFHHPLSLSIIIAEFHPVGIRLLLLLETNARSGKEVRRNYLRLGTRQEKEVKCGPCVLAGGEANHLAPLAISFLCYFL